MTEVIDFLVGFSKCLLLIISCLALVMAFIVGFFLFVFELTDYIYEKFNKENKK